MGSNKTRISEFMDRIEWLEKDRRELKAEILQLIVTSKAQREAIVSQETEIKHMTFKNNRIARELQDNLKRCKDTLDFCDLKPLKENTQ